MTLGDTIIPWLLGTLLLLALLMLVVTIKSWREMKRSPYFFLRRQAEKRLQTYSLASMVLILAATVTSGYAWSPVQDSTPRVAILTNSKPPKEEVIALVNAVSTEPADVALRPDGVELEQSLPIDTLAIDTLAVDAIDIDTSVAPPTVEELLPQVEEIILPEEFDAFEPETELNSDTLISELAFSTEIGGKYEAINPRRIFAEGFYTLYATFDYEDMENGMEWSWVWKLNGAVVDGGNELWQYGSSGPGYIFLSPEEGFQNGEYGLEVWVNGEMLSNSAVIMNNAAVAAGN